MIFKRIPFLILILGVLINFTLKGKNKVILLNGTSSAGKSTVAQALLSILNGATEIVNGDRIALDIADKKFIEEFKRPPSSDEERYTYLNLLYDQGLGPRIWDEVRQQAYERTGNLFLNGKNVIIDLEYINNQNKLNQCLNKLANIPVFIVLIYCPLDQLFQRVTSRNQSNDKTEYRKLDIPFVGFFDLYKKQTTEHEIFIDCLKKDSIEKAFEQIKEKAKQIEKDRMKLEMFLWMTDQRTKKIFTTFDFFNYQETIITCKINHDLMVNTAAFTPDECARQIVTALQNFDTNNGITATPLPQQISCSQVPQHRL